MTGNVSHATLQVVGSVGPVAPGNLLPTTQAQLPQTADHLDLWLGILGVLVLLAVFVLAKRRLRRWLAVLLIIGGMWELTATAAHAAVLPPTPDPAKIDWNEPPATPTPAASLTQSGFSDQTLQDKTVTASVGQPITLDAHYHRSILTDLGKPLTFWLRIWRLTPTAQGRFQATKVAQQTQAKTMGPFEYDALLPFAYTPQKPAVHAIQYTTTGNTNAPTASKLAWIRAEQAATGLTITAPNVVFGTKEGSLPFTASATTTPTDATDLIAWQPSDNLTAPQLSGNPLTFTAKASDAINWDPNRDGLPATLAATAGQAHATQSLTVGGLAAIDVNGDVVSQTGLCYTAHGLTELSKQLPATHWHYRWTLISTKANSQGQLVPNYDDIQALDAFGDVKGATGDTDNLADEAVAFQAPRNSSLFQQLSQNTAAKRPRLLQLTVSGAPNGKPVTLVSNLAGFSVSKPHGELSLTSVPANLNWQLKPLDVYDRVAKPLTSTPLKVSDTRTEPGWALSATLDSKAFPFSLQIGQRGPVLSTTQPTATIASGATAAYSQTPQFTLTPTGDADQQNYQATINWTLASTVAAKGL
ncbi:LPXTG cell wall anchor domain-containing protein [Lacticaseibacillus sp. GG6-2]